MLLKKFHKILGFWVIMLLFALLVLSVTPTHTTAQEPNAFKAATVSEIEIRLADVPPDLDQTLWLQAARDLIGIRPRETFAEARLKASLEALRASKLFEAIHLDSKPDGERIRLIFTISPFRRVRDIRIKGQFPLFKKDVLQAMTLYPGSPFSLKEDPLRQQQRIAALYQKEGFESARVSVHFEEKPDNLFVSVQVRIDKGPFFRLRELHMDGNQAFADSVLKRRLSIWRQSFLPGSMGRFKALDLNNSIKRLTEWYRRQKYADVVVEHRFEKKPATGEVAVWLSIQEGRRYEITFNGNRRFGNRTLRKDMILFKEGNLHDFGLKRSAQNIVARYRSAGFPQVQVKTEETSTATEDVQVRRINFNITEGPRRVVAAVQVKGNRSIATKNILEPLLTRPKELFHDGALNPDTLEEDLYAVRALYLKQGFMAAEVNQTTVPAGTAENVAVEIVVDEGVQTLVAEVRVIGSRAISEAEALDAVQMKSGQPLREYMLQSDKNVLSALISEKGYPHVFVDPQVAYNADRSLTEIVYKIDDGPEVKVGNIYFNGNFRTAAERLQSELLLKTGQPFALQRLSQGQRNLNNMNIFKSVNVRTFGLKEKDDDVHLLVDVEEKKPLYVQAGVGYDTERGLYSQARGGDRNFLGRNKDVWLSGEFSQIGYRAEAGITEPKLAGWPVSASWNLYAEEVQEFNQDFGTRVIGTAVALKRKWRLRWTTGFGLRFEQRQQFTSENKQPLDADEFGTRSIVVATPSIRYDSRDSFVRPQRGTITGLIVDVSSGLNNDLDNFVKYRFDFRSFYTPFEPLTLAWIGRAGYIYPLAASKNVYEDQLFFLGGTADVRGYRENLLRFDANGKPVGGQTAISGSMEARLDVGRNFEITGFFDTGRVSRAQQNVGSDEFRNSVGVGVRYHTPIGPIGLLYGHKLDRRPDEGSGRWHFSIGYTF